MNVEKMVSQLKSDLKNSTSTSYNSKGEIRLRVNDFSITWELYKGHLNRWVFPNTVVSKEKVTTFKFQFVFGKYFAYEVFSKGNCLLNGMIETQG
jgi:hypothetical protein